MATVQLQSIKKSYGAVEVIHGVDLDIEDGEFVALVGPSGCGKSTLLRMVAGLESVSGGRINIDEKNVNSVQPKDRDIAMVFQNYALYPNLNVRENMAFSLSMRGKESKDRINERVQEAADVLGLHEYLDRYPRALSGGQRQRVAMGRAIVRQPKVFLFDEPLSNLDAKLRVKMRTQIKQLHQQFRTTTIYVTHDQVEAMTMADKIVVLRAGHIEQVGPPLDLYRRPANTFVAGFIGSPSMNFMDATIASGHIMVSDTEVLAAAAGAPIGKVTLGIRPEHIMRSPDGMEAKVVVVEPTGPETFVVLSALGAEIIAIFRDEDIPSPGDTINIGFQSERTHFFDPDTGHRCGD